MSYHNDHIEDSGELPQGHQWFNRNGDSESPGSPLKVHRWLVGVLAAAAGSVLLYGSSATMRTQDSRSAVESEYTKLLAIPIMGKKKKIRFKDFTDEDKWKEFEPERRCDWVVDHFTARYAGIPEDELRVQYAVQSQDANVFYRATASIFWVDFTDGYYGGDISFQDIITSEATLEGDVHLGISSTWTWVTGDQHLSNFGAWRNRHGDVVFGVNDFDEAAIFDFHVDVIRVAVSIYSHARTNGLSKKDTRKAVHAFTDSYLDTVCGYVGNDKAETFELTTKTSKGKLKEFLDDVEEGRGSKRQLKKFTEVGEDGNRRFTRDENTRLVSVSPEVEKEIRDAFTSQKYGATMLKTGWKVRPWDDDFFAVLDIARRVGSGVGSYGVDRYYVLLKGTDGLLGEDGEDGAAVILDVKYEPTPAVSYVLNADDSAWYDVIFNNEAARAVEGQRRLTSYVDPFTGWVILGGREFYVRQRSPFKDSPDLDKITNIKLFTEFAKEVGIATATSHTRGTVAKSPGQFKEVIASIFGKNTYNRKAWGNAVERVAHHYRQQVVMDFECFKEYVDENYPLEK